jgi:hypothetical protein
MTTHLLPYVECHVGIREKNTTVTIHLGWDFLLRSNVTIGAGYHILLSLGIKKCTCWAEVRVLPAGIEPSTLTTKFSRAIS